MPMNEHDELAENVRNLGAVSRPPRSYVERGISRREHSRPQYDENSATETARRADHSRSVQVEREDRATASNNAAKSEPEQPKRAHARFNRSHTSRRALAEDEQPPLIDSLREAAVRKRRREQEFNDRYDRSRTGASRVEREKVSGGNAVRDVEYFVPKMFGDNASDINYGTRKRKTLNKNPMRMWKKASLTAVSLFMVFILCMGMGVNVLLNRMNFVSDAEKNITQHDSQADAEAAALADGVDDSELELPDAVMFDSDIENVLLIGSDRRSTSELGRSDAMMLVTIDRKHKKIKMTSFLRDLYIKIPGKYGTKLNSAYSVGGVDLTKATIEANLGITIDKYVIIDFTAFKTVVNKIGKLNGKGGIKITVTAAEANYMCNHETYGLFPRFQKGAGTYYMTGAEALNYARIRKIDSDFGRTNRQRKVLAQIVEEMKDIGYVDLISIGYSCLEYVTTDFTKGELVGLATEAGDIMNYQINQISIPIQGTYENQEVRAGNQALVANLKVNATQLAAFIYDDDMTYEGNKTAMKNVKIPSVKSIANSNATTKSTTTTTAAGSTTTTAEKKSSGGTITSRIITKSTTASKAG